MNQFNLGNFLNRFAGYNNPTNMGRGSSPANASGGPETGLPMQEFPNQIMTQKGILPQILDTFSPSMMMRLRMNDLASFERSLYAKDLMNMPKDLEEVLVLVQNKLVTAEELPQLLSSNINLSTLAELIQKGGKEAMNKLVQVMAEASKQGIADISQLKDTMKLINASVAVAGQDNPNQILKSFMLLYLPWLPLQEGVDFDLEIEHSEEESGESEVSITIMISTRNFGNVRVTLVLLGGNSMSIFVNCSENFPKEELLKRINSENKNRSMHSEVIFEQKAMKQDQNATPQAKVSLSNLKEVNPFLLLMANAIIRHTIELDNLAG